MYRQRPPVPPRVRDEPAGGARSQHCAGWTAEYILTSFRSHDPAIQLTPVLVGPIRATAAATKEGVQEAADMVVSRVRRRPDASGPPGK
jgi:hypothetical protein